MPDYIAPQCDSLLTAGFGGPLASTPAVAIDGTAALDRPVRHAVDPLVGQTVRVLATGEVGDVTAIVYLTGRALCQLQWLAPDPKEPGKQRKVTAYAYPEHLEVLRGRAQTVSDPGMRTSSDRESGVSQSQQPRRNEV